MKLSKRGEYALRSLINLGIAGEVGRSLVQVSELAASDQMPIKFLEQILQDIKDAGLIASVRGKYGGYRLAKPMHDITIGEVVRLVDGPLAPIGCVSQSAYEKCTCPDEEHCGLRMLMLDVRNAIAGILDRYTLADVVEVTLRKLRRNNLPLPFAPELDANGTPVPRARRAVARGAERARTGGRAKSPRLDSADGVLHQLLSDYSI